MRPITWWGFRNRSRRFRLWSAVMKSRRSIHPFLSISRSYRSGKWRSTPAIVRPSVSTSWSLRRNFASLPHIGQNSSRKYPWEWHSLSIVPRGEPRGGLNLFGWGSQQRRQIRLAHGFEAAVAEERLQRAERGLPDRLPMEVHELRIGRPIDRTLEGGIVGGLECVRGH